MKVDNMGFINRWVIFFDILGFKRICCDANSSFDYFSILSNYEETLLHLDKVCNDYEEGLIKNTWFSDSFIIYSEDDSAKSYSIIQSAAKHFLTKNIINRVPLRGAISFGSLYVNQSTRTYIGKALVEAYTFGEAQDWIGLILTPTAIEQVKKYGLNPFHHDFTDKDIPMKEFRDSVV